MNLVTSNRPRFLDAAPLATRRFAIHGQAVELQSDLPQINAEALTLFHPFEVAEWPEGFHPLVGRIEPFDADAIQRHVSPSATRVASPHHAIELYRDAEKFWLIDERWGMSEINLLRGQWRSWILPNPSANPTTAAETAVVWPLAQLLRFKGLHLLPAVSIARDGFGALILAPFGIEPELSALARNGYQIIGQRWTALRPEDGRLAMLHLPGFVERHSAPRLRYLGIEPAVGRLDLNQEFPATYQNHAFCDAVLIADPARRSTASLHHLTHAAAISVLRKSWPIADLHPNRIASHLPPKLAQSCRCAQLQLSKNPQDLLRLLDGFRPRPGSAPVQSRFEMRLTDYHPKVARAI